MPLRMKRAPLQDEVRSALTWLKRQSTKRTLNGMARYGIPSDNALGVTMADMKALAKRLGRNHQLAAALWDTGGYEARMLASFVDEPARVTSTQMDRWCGDFDNWGVCDTVCFHLQIKRAAFALLWGLTVHDKHADDKPFAEGLHFVELAATDERHFVKKSVNMALRAVGKRNSTLNAAAVGVARRLADSPQATARWVGKDAFRELTSAGVTRRLAARRPVTAGAMIKG